YHGKALLLTFIYTRCPLPDYCPLMSKNFNQIMQALRSDMALNTATHMLRISIDPDFDNPSVLRAYGRTDIAKPSPILSCVGNSPPAVLSRSARSPGFLD